MMFLWWAIIGFLIGLVISNRYRPIVGWVRSFPMKRCDCCRKKFRAGDGAGTTVEVDLQHNNVIVPLTLILCGKCFD